METVNNVVYSMRLQSTSFDKKSYLTYLKSYMKKVKTALEEKAKAEGATDEDKERPEKFVAAAQNYAKKIVANFKDWEFYTGESMDPDGMVVLLNYREDGTTPYLVYFKDGLKIEKVVCILLSQLLMLSKNVFSPLSPLLSCLLDKVMYAHTNSSCNAILHIHILLS